jgi:hypothetical protein
LENHVCLSRGVHVAGAAWRAAMRIVAGVRDLVQRIGDGRTGQELSGRVTMSTSFLVEPQNQGRRFESCLVSKSLGRFSPV